MLKGKVKFIDRFQSRKNGFLTGGVYIVKGELHYPVKGVAKNPKFTFKIVFNHKA